MRSLFAFPLPAPRVVRHEWHAGRGLGLGAATILRASFCPSPATCRKRLRRTLSPYAEQLWGEGDHTVPWFETVPFGPLLTMRCGIV